MLRDGRFVICEETKKLNEDRLVEYMTGIQISQIMSEEAEIHKVSSDVVLELDHMSNDKVEEVSLKLHRGEILGLYGLVGAGRTEILQSIFGITPVRSGKIRIRGREVEFRSIHEAIAQGIGLAPESRKTQGLVLPLSVWENMCMVSLKSFKRGGRLSYSEMNRVCGEYVEKLKVKTPSIFTRTGNLSGGNQQKVILAKWLLQDCDILLLDEPTQGIDVVAKEEIYKLIREMTAAGKSVIVVSSELQELLRVCDNIHVMYDGRQVMEVNKVNFNADQILHASVVGRSAS